MLLIIISTIILSVLLLYHCFWYIRNHNKPVPVNKLNWKQKIYRIRLSCATFCFNKLISVTSLESLRILKAEKQTIGHKGPKPVVCPFRLFIESYSTLHLLQNTFYSIKIFCF